MFSGSNHMVDEYSSVSARWNKIKDTIDTQVVIGRRFDKAKMVINHYINSFCINAGYRDIDWFVNLGDGIQTIPVVSEFGQSEVESMDRAIALLSDLKEGIQGSYCEALLNCVSIQNMLRSIDTCKDNLNRLKARAQEQIRINAQRAEDAEHRREVRQARRERQELLRQRREQEEFDELRRIAESAAQRRAAASVDEEESQEYQVTYINDEIKSECQKFLRTHKDAEPLWRKWFNEVRVTGSSTTNYLPNMRSQRSAFLRFRRGLIQLAPNDVIYEARLDTSGEQAGMRVVYYIEKGTHKVVILYVGLPFGVIHKNVRSVLIEYANFPEASLDDCEVSSDSESATESASSAAAGSKSDKSSKSSKSSLDDDDDDDSEEEGGAARSSAPKKNKKNKRKKKSSRDHHKGYKK